MNESSCNLKLNQTIVRYFLGKRKNGIPTSWTKILGSGISRTKFVYLIFRWILDILGITERELFPSLPILFPDNINPKLLASLKSFQQDKEPSYDHPEPKEFLDIAFPNGCTRNCKI